MKFVLIVSLMLLSACASQPKSLDQFSDHMDRREYEEAIALGGHIRRAYRDKTYSLTGELFSVFLPDDALSDYVLESYERIFLTYQIATAYIALNKKGEAAVELRQADVEARARLYNFGEDPVNALLIAAAWEKLGDFDSARPYWSQVHSGLPVNDPVASFADQRVFSIDRGARLKPIEIETVGEFPELKWKIDFTRSGSGYYEINPTREFPDSCARSEANQDSLMLPTSYWIKKIGNRYASDYHPLLHAKSWIRFPIGLAYTVTTFTAGLGVAVGGCAADITGKANGELCKLSAEAGGELMSASGKVFDYSLRPDLRHWKRVPMAIKVGHGCDSYLDGIQLR